MTLDQLLVQDNNPYLDQIITPQRAKLVPDNNFIAVLCMISPTCSNDRPHNSPKDASVSKVGLASTASVSTSSKLMPERLAFYLAGLHLGVLLSACVKVWRVCMLSSGRQVSRLLCFASWSGPLLRPYGCSPSFWLKSQSQVVERGLLALLLGRKGEWRLWGRMTLNLHDGSQS